MDVDDLLGVPCHQDFNLPPAGHHGDKMAVEADRGHPSREGPLASGDEHHP